MKKGTVLLLFTLLLAVGVKGQLVRKYSNEFLSVGVGARGLAMSNAQAATTSDVYSNYYNPPGWLT